MIWLEGFDEMKFFRGEIENIFVDGVVRVVFIVYLCVGVR